MDCYGSNMSEDEKPRLSACTLEVGTVGEPLEFDGPVFTGTLDAAAIMTMPSGPQSQGRCLCGWSGPWTSRSKAFHDIMEHHRSETCAPWLETIAPFGTPPDDGPLVYVRLSESFKQSLLDWIEEAKTPTANVEGGP